MNRLLKDWGFALVVGAAVYLLARWWGGRPPEIEAPAPNFEAAMLDGSMVDLESLRGRTVVLNFWASWCAPCRAEIPEFSKFAKQNPDISVLGLAVDSGGVTEVREAADRFGISYPVALASSSTQRAYGVSALPTTVVIGPEGQVLYSQVGPMSERDLIAATK